MRKYIKPVLILFMAFLIVGGCNGDGGNDATTRTIGPGGGTITSADGRLTLEIPAGALDQDTEITIRKLNPGDFEETFGKTPDFAYQLEPDGLEFNVPVTAALEQDDGATDSEGNISFKDVILLSVSGDEIEMLETQEQVLDGDTDENTVSGELTHFSELLSFTFDGFIFSLENVPDSVPPNTQFTAMLIIIGTVNVSDLVLQSEVNIANESFGAVTGLFDFIESDLPSTNGEIVELLSFRCGEGTGSALVRVRPDIEEVFPFLLGSIVTRSKSTILGKTVTCMDETSPTPEPPPPPIVPTPIPTMMPPAPPAMPMIGDVSGTYALDCSAEQDTFAIINVNLGIPFMIDAIVEVNSETGAVTITTPDGLFTLMGTIVDQGEGIFRIEVAQGSGMLGDMSPNAANIIVRAEGWTFFVNQEGGIEFLSGGLRFNFPGLPLNSQSSVASCISDEEN